MVRTGAHGYIQYGMEPTYKGTATMTRQFGLDASLTNHRINQNPIPLGKLNSVLIQKFARGRFEGSYSVDAALSSPWIFHPTLGAVQTSGSNPYNHTFTVTSNLPSFAMETGFQGEIENSVRVLKGGGVNTFTLRSAINQVARISIDVMYGEEASTPSTSIDSSVVDDDILFPYTFEYGTLEVPSGSVLAELQSVEVTVNNKVGFGYGHGSSGIYASSMYRGMFEPSLRFNVAKKSRSEVMKVLARAEIASAVLKFTNGLTGANEKSITMTMSTLEPAEHAWAKRVNEPVFQDLTLPFTNLTVVANNNISTPP